MATDYSWKLLAAPPHKAGRPFLYASLVMLLLGLVAAPWLFWLGLVLLVFCLFFFRDPERVPPLAPDIVVAPADGLVCRVDAAPPPPELGLGTESLPRVAIFLSVLNVHVTRMPADGVVSRIAYRPGRFLNASLDKASDENERNAVALRLADGRALAVVQIAGLVARRIVCDAREGDTVRAGDRFGIIRFGSRVDVYLPAGTVPLARPGQTMIGGETVLATLVRVGAG